MDANRAAVHFRFVIGEWSGEMRTQEKYREMGFTELSGTKVQDRHGDALCVNESETLTP